MCLFGRLKRWNFVEPKIQCSFKHSWFAYFYNWLEIIVCKRLTRGKVGLFLAMFLQLTRYSATKYEAGANDWIFFRDGWKCVVDGFVRIYSRVVCIMCGRRLYRILHINTTYLGYLGVSIWSHFSVFLRFSEMALLAKPSILSEENVLSFQWQIKTSSSLTRSLAKVHD